MHSPSNHEQLLRRRFFLRQSALGLGAIAFAENFADKSDAAEATRPQETAPRPMTPRVAHFPAKVKNVIYLFMAGGPSQLELFSPKPVLNDYHNQKPPESFMEGRRFAFLKSDAKLLGSARSFDRYGECGMDLSELLPHHRKIVDDVCWMRAVSTDVFNHGPAKLFMNCGFQAPGRPSLGSWVTYGLGSECQDLPGFVVLQSGPRGPRAGSALWSSGFLPTGYQGVPFRSKGSPILHLSNPAGIDRERQQDFTSTLSQLNQMHMDQVSDPEIATRMQAYETAFAMQMSAPELSRIEDESQETLDAYGVQEGQPSFAKNCLLARRLVQRGVRFVQLYHTDWDHHGGKENLEGALDAICKEVDQASAALVLDLKQRGLLDETLVIWGGEFGRTPMGEVRATIGRDHHVDAFTMWMAGGGIKPGYIHGATDELGFGPTEGRVHVHDLHATILHLLGLNHKRLTYRFQGRDFRLTDVHGELVPEILA
ncbi:DUF1501 domain-containing protein [Roseiconus nitratireducens]|uniref:DUF1501 domain-containing protein n=1 Tax=Roseiconus nitratireducens TaxID=2605748 RepID=A0A5M6D6H6_9BACT|nr:DUF1501 domain-containing protein [Roseiconus nitratireducens]KAA5541842.1 DUF1501 domain-containing protein [Roseiconus nitratireducens]